MGVLESRRTGARMGSGMLVWVDPGSDLPPAAIEVDPALAVVEMAVEALEETRLSWHMRDTPPPRESCSRAVPGVAAVDESAAGEHTGTDLGSVASPLSPPDFRGMTLCEDVGLRPKGDAVGTAAGAKRGGDTVKLSAGVDSGTEECAGPVCADDGAVGEVGCV